MTYLTYELMLRAETDESAIATLMRKGWIEVPQPNFNPATQTCEWVAGQWVVSEIVIPVPQQVSMWALREAVMRDGKIVDVDYAINELPEPDKSIARNRWDFKPSIKRYDAIISRLQSVLGWSDSYVDDLYKSANSIANS